LIIFSACRRIPQIFQPTLVLKVHHPLHSIWSSCVLCYLQECDWSPPMFFSFCRLSKICLCLCLSPSMLTKIYHKLQKHKSVLWNSWKESNKNSRKERGEDWLGNHYCTEFLLEFTNLILTKIYYMGVAELDLAGS
jgi:hypothetical protein